MKTREGGLKTDFVGYSPHFTAWMRYYDFAKNLTQIIFFNCLILLYKDGFKVVIQHFLLLSKLVLVWNVEKNLYLCCDPTKVVSKACRTGQTFFLIM